MIRHPTNPTCRNGRWQRRLCLLLTLGFFWTAVAVILSGGCAAERRYKVLSFFFDGVPDPNAPPGAGTGDEGSGTGAGGSPKLLAVVHKPYLENKCDACHQQARGTYESFSKADPKVCLNCHANVVRQYPVMHGPVVAVECLWCHTPHESSVPHLLKESSPGVCRQCHERDMMSPRPPDHLTDRNCLDCHSGHGGSQRFMLFASVPAAPAATQSDAGAQP